MRLDPLNPIVGPTESPKAQPAIRLPESQEAQHATHESRTPRITRDPTCYIQQLDSQHPSRPDPLFPRAGIPESLEAPPSVPDSCYISQPNRGPTCYTLQLGSQNPLRLDLPDAVRSTWILLGLPGYFWLLQAPQAPPGVSWLPVASPGTAWVLLGSPRFSLLLLAHPGSPGPPSSSCLFLAYSGSWLPLGSPGSA